MRLLKLVRKHKCVYWGAPIPTGTEMRFPQPVECKCRWDAKSSTLRLRKGGEYLSTAIVMMDRLTVEDGFLWYGKLEDLKLQYPTTYDDPREIPDAKVIKKTETISTMRNGNLTNMNKVAHWAYL